VEPNLAYGYGLELTPDHHGVSLIEHGGGRKGISAHVGVVRDRALTCAVLTNLADVAVRRVGIGAINTLLGLPVDAPSQDFAEVPVRPDQLAAYAGEYRSGEGQTIRVQATDAGLVFEIDGRRYPSRAVGADAFVVQGQLTEKYARFLAGASGGVWALAYGLRIIRKTG